MYITSHAVEKFMKLTGATDFKRSRNKLQEMFNQSYPVQLKPRWRLHKAFKHNNPANYFRYSDWIFVTDVADATVITCYLCGDERWEERRRIPKWAEQL
jgi:hypothetical protein